MIKKITSPLAIAALLMLAGAMAIPVTISANGTDAASCSNRELLLWGIGIFTLGVTFVTFLLLFKIWRWEHFLRVRAVGKVWLFLLMNAVTLAIFPSVKIYLRFFVWLYSDLLGISDTILIPLVGICFWNLVILVMTNIILLLALPHTKLPAPMKIRYSHSSKELNAWRVLLAILFLLNTIYLALCTAMGAVMGIIAAVVYMYVLFSLHAGKIAWKEECSKHLL